MILNVFMVNRTDSYYRGRSSRWAKGKASGYLFASKNGVSYMPFVSLGLWAGSNTGAGKHSFSLGSGRQ